MSVESLYLYIRKRWKYKYHSRKGFVLQASVRSKLLLGFSLLYGLSVALNRVRLGEKLRLVVGASLLLGPTAIRL